MYIIIHQTHYGKSDWARAFNQFTIACELDMINAISAADIALIMSSSTCDYFDFNVMVVDAMVCCEVFFYRRVVVGQVFFCSVM